MERKESYATQEEFKKRVIRYRDVPAIELRPGAKSHIVSTERLTVSFATAVPNSVGPVHRHEAEQIMIVTDGACDYIIEGKLYHVQTGDVVVIPPNIEHGGYVSNKGFSVIDIFSPSRQDYVARLEEVKKSKS